VTNAFAMLRLLPMSNRDKDVEILSLRHQLTVLERHLRNEKVRFAASDRAFPAALLHRLPRDVLRSVRLLVRPDTMLRWHRDLVAAAMRPSHGRSVRAGRRPCGPSVPWCFARPRRIPAGATGACTANCWCWQ
jgi:hypothetical protein